MHKNDPPTGDEKQASIDLSGCRFAPIPGTGIHLVIPGHEAVLRLSVQLGIPGRFKVIRAGALHNLAAGAEAFAMRTFGLSDRLYLSVSLLTNHDYWRGGWLLYFCPAGQEEKLIEYIETARGAVVTDLRKERASGGSRS